ncbi:ABC transporter substrate-binding protein [Paracoccus sp. IB05]|uniref:ABC transporter substrate-binding protein n=1 Tax=Paracoccus sp. IB05 TaxID=2779367 RepID=UPI0018E87C1E|nr:ABC transporter substrate-binding protein [Paracoccus sp. IB05]MBJ2150501.1 carbohydrate ABC transporter substrate-binding protein [Paracoccus sp. IB05]
MNMRIACAPLAICMAMSGNQSLAQDLTGEIKIWSWNVAASAMETVGAEFMAANPGVKVVVEDLGNQGVYDRMLAGCAAGGNDLPDLMTVENHEAEIFWTQFPSCFADLNELGYTPEMQAIFPEFKRVELESNGASYAMPWDSGPVVMFYRRDIYAAGGVDPATIVTWADFIAAGARIQAASPGVTMSQADLNGDTDWFRMIANEQGCGYFSADGQSININAPGCVAALDALRSLYDAGLLRSASWDEKIQSNNASTVATQMFGGWYEGSIRTTSPEEQSGLWGMYLMPSVTADGGRAANLGGSSLAMSGSSDNKEAAFAFLKFALATDKGQITMLRDYGLVPSLLSSANDPFTAEGQPFWGDQPVWQLVLGTLPAIKPSHGTPYFGDADAVFRAVQLSYLNGGYPDAKAALDDAAQQIELVTGLPLAQ